MNGAKELPDETQQASTWLSVLILSATLALMFWLKLRLFPEHYIALGYALPLLLCLWHKDRRLLWAMAFGFAVISALKAFVVFPGQDQQERFELLQWLMQMTNIVVVGLTVHTILNLTERLRLRNADLLVANNELCARGEEITRQNSELQAQAEELVRQNEELQQQGEELGRQNEELQQQAEELERQSEELQRQTQELHGLNQQLNQREGMLQTLLGCLGGAQGEQEMLEQVCRLLIDLVGQSGCVAAVLQRVDDELVLLTQAGAVRLSESPRAFAGSFSAIVMEHDRTAFVDDLSARADLSVPQPDGRPFRSVLATPLRLHGKPLGVVKLYAFEPRKWTAEQFRIIEWVAAQCSLALGIMRLQEALGRTNARLEEQVRERTASLQEMVNELEHFSYTITHDMRAPLRAIRGFVGVLEDQVGPGLSGESKGCLERISSAARRMDRLITDALSYSKTVQSELVLCPVDAAELLRGIIQSYPSLQPPRARIVVSGEIPRVLANEAGLTQCFSNLLDNAVKFVEPGRLPEVLVRAETRNGVARLWFEDNGIGIPETFWPRLFQMFQRANKSFEGTGIGLALVRKVAERMGGRVGMESALDIGSRFWIELRLAVEDSHPPETHEEKTGSPNWQADFQRGSLPGSISGAIFQSGL